MRPEIRTRGAKLLRYCVVSGVATVTGLTILGVLVLTGAPAGWANVAATAIGTVPSFELNRRWVWSVTGRPSWSRQVLPFLAWSFAELLGSTLVVHLAGEWAGGHHLASIARTVVVETASITSFGVFWVAQYVLLDRLLFRRRVI
jgi:putative flippase GtrA